MGEFFPPIDFKKQSEDKLRLLQKLEASFHSRVFQRLSSERKTTEKENKEKLGVCWERMTLIEFYTDPEWEFYAPFCFWRRGENLGYFWFGEHGKNFMTPGKADEYRMNVQNVLVDHLFRSVTNQRASKFCNEVEIPRHTKSSRIFAHWEPNLL